MTETGLTNFLLGILVLITCTIFIWTINYISTSNTTNPPTAISAFNA